MQLSFKARTVGHIESLLTPPSTCNPNSLNRYQKGISLLELP